MNSQLFEKIQNFKKERKAVILAHNYQPGEIQDLADFTGDSLGLSIQAAKSDAEVIIFCGVHFMAETAYILSPKKIVILPEPHAGCPMANMINAEQLRTLKQHHKNAVVVCYVNSSAEVKAESDYCCTSANAVEVVNSLGKNQKIIFVPDQYLGQFVAQRTGRDLILWPGYCPTHQMITEDDIKKAKAEHPEAIVMAHPECTEPVKKLADQILSTSQMIKFAAKNIDKEFIIATENGIIHSLKKQNPQGKFYPATERALCPNMKKITLDKLLTSLETMEPKIVVPEEIRLKAKKAVDRMIEILPLK